MNEDPADRHKKNISSIELVVDKMDKEGLLLKPSRKEMEIGVLNPAVYQDGLSWPLPFLYRSVRRDNVSIIKHRELIEPTKLGKESRILIQPTEPYENRGCEDPRVTKIGNCFYITYTAYDGINARIALAKTKDFKEIEKLGIIGPQISAEEAIKLVDDKYYKKVWGENQIYKKRGLLWDKDASLHFIKGKWIFLHRLEPDMHIAFADNLEQFQNPEYWRENIRNLSEHIFMRAEDGEKKIGLGGPLVNISGRIVGLYHGVDSDLNYCGSFFEVNRDFIVISRMKNPLLRPDSERCVFEESDERGRRIKRVIFPTAMSIGPKDKSSLILYYGVGDKEIDWRSTSLEWLFGELDANRYVT